MIKTSQVSQILPDLADALKDIQQIKVNYQTYFKTKLENIYSSLSASPDKGGEFDPVIYLIEQNKAENLQKSLFEEIKNVKSQLLSKYSEIQNKVSLPEVIQAATAAANAGTLTIDERRLFGDNPALAADMLQREKEIIELELDNLKAIIVVKSVLLPQVNQINELESLYNYTLEKMKNTIDPIAYVGDLYQYGYSIANIFKDISNDYAKKAQNQAYEPFSDSLNKNALKYQREAQKWMMKTDKDALPGLFSRLGRDATPSGDTPSTVSLSGVINNMSRFAKKSSKNAEENNGYVSYWDELMDQSLDPVDWGTIVKEKPKHKDKTIKEEQELHQTKRKTRFKK